MSLTKEQLAFRRTGLTATDMVVLAGESPYGDTIYDVYSEKCLPNPTERPSTEPMRWGNLIEPLIVDEVSVRNDVHIIYPCNTARSVDIDWAMATVDARIVGPGSHVSREDCYGRGNTTESLIECKVVGHRKAHLWPEMDDGAMPPDSVIIQANWQMFVTGVHKCIVAALLGTELRTYDLTFDIDLSSALLEIGTKFWTDHVLPFRDEGKFVAPPVDGSEASREMLARMWPKHREGMIAADDSTSALARAYLLAKKQEKEAKERADLASAKLKEIVQDNQGIDGPDWRLYWSYREPVHIAAYDKEGYRAFDLRMKGKK